MGLQRRILARRALTIFPSSSAFSISSRFPFQRQPLKPATRADPQPATRNIRPQLSRLFSSSGRYASNIPFKPQGISIWKYTMRQHPILFPVGIFWVVFGSIAFVWAAVQYARVHREFSVYPERVGLKIRRAMYYTDVEPDAAQAFKAHNQGLAMAQAEGMDSLGDEVLGQKAEFARCLEKFNRPDEAIRLLDEAKRATLKWIRDHQDEPEHSTRRTRLLLWAVKLSMAMAGYYAHDAIRNEQKVEENLVWSVETGLREHQRRQREGVREREGDWLTPDEMGSQFEELGQHYEGKGQLYYASQLFLQALMIKPEKDCHAVVLMNNLAASVAQQSPPTEPGTPPPSREQLRQSGRTWLMQALALAESIEPPTRTPECDRGCAVALHNLGEFAEMDGNVKEARSKYDEAGSIAHAIGFEEGVISANEGLKRLGEKPHRQTRRGWV